MLATNASAYDIDFSVKNADGVMIYYAYTNVNQTEVMVTYKSESYNSYSGSVVIPKEVTYNKKTLKVTAIAYEAFKNCSQLTSITIPNSIKNIYMNAFEGCSKLKSITIPNGITRIESSIFEGCKR